MSSTKKVILNILALCGVPLGGYLIVLAFTTQLDSPTTNNIVLLLGIVMFIGCGLYLFVKLMGRLIK